MSFNQNNLVALTGTNYNVYTGIDLPLRPLERYPLPIQAGALCSYYKSLSIEELSNTQLGLLTALHSLYTTPEATKCFLAAIITQSGLLRVRQDLFAAEDLRDVVSFVERNLPTSLPGVCYNSRKLFATKTFVDLTNEGTISYTLVQPTAKFYAYSSLVHILNLLNEFCNGHPMPAITSLFALLSSSKFAPRRYTNLLFDIEKSFSEIKLSIFNGSLIVLSPDLPDFIKEAMKDIFFVMSNKRISYRMADTEHPMLLPYPMC
ncbi:hypothetical protein [Acetivibrio ethanolgignens]|uniref:Uncharacterized protein n=1 Tax=Acetivibrio ethanolgignens TaxID=290052 RepID=A0A0V8QJ34_9FIRM|nr:hypothetical protein [Acetivibrio ethanolgignens]KSV60246.1 hypothetical protein ASU35_17140 [Acetivibrio ethanolgignens]